MMTTYRIQYTLAVGAAGAVAVGGQGRLRVRSQGPGRAFDIAQYVEHD